MWSSDGERDGDTFGAESARPPEGGTGGSRVWGWASKYAWRSSVAIILLITAADALLGPRVLLIGLLLVGPGCVLFSARRVRRQRPVPPVGLLCLGPPRRDLGHRAAIRLHRRRLDRGRRLHLGRRDHGIGDQALSRRPLRPGILGRTDRSEVAMERIRLHRDQIALVAAVALTARGGGHPRPIPIDLCRHRIRSDPRRGHRGDCGLGQPLLRVRGHGLCHCVVRLLPHPPLREACHHPPAGHRDCREVSSRSGSS